MVRRTRFPVYSVAEWAHMHGLPLAPDHILADVIGGVLNARNRTKHGRSKVIAAARVWAAHRETQIAYEVAIHSGRIPMATRLSPLDPSSRADQAYAKVMAKRAARRAQLTQEERT